MIARLVLPALVALAIVGAPHRAQAQGIDPRVLAIAAAGAAAIFVDEAVAERVAWAPDHRRRAGILSDVVVGSAVAWPCLEDRTRDCLRTAAIRVGTTIVTTELVKRWVDRERPDRSDRLSFYSGHTALACVGGFGSKRQVAGAAVCAAAGYLRMSAKRHWLTDVAVGAGVGWAMSRIGR